MRQNQPLPIAVEHILTEARGKAQPAAARTRLEQQVYLGVMPQRLEMPHALDRRLDRLAVDDAARPKRDRHAEAVEQKPLQHLELHLAHELHMQLAQLLVPHDMELRVLLLQKPQALHRRVRLAVCGQNHLICEKALEHRRRRIRLRAEALARIRFRQPRHGADAAGRYCFRKLEFPTRVDAELVGLLRPRLLPRAARKHRLDGQCAARHLEVGQPRALRVVPDLVDLRAECRRILRRARVFFEPAQKRLHTLELQGGAEPAGEELSRRNQRPNGLRLHAPRLQICGERFLAAHGNVFQKIAALCGKVHAAVGKAALQRCEQRLPVRAAEIHLVDENERGHRIALEQPPERARVALHAVRAADDEHGVIEHLQSALHLARKIHVAGRVQQRELRLPERQHSLLRENRDPALALLHVGVEKGALVVDAPELPELSARVEHRLRKRRFSGVDVRQYAQNQLFHRFSQSFRLAFRLCSRTHPFARAAASALFLRLLYHFPRRLTTSRAFPAFFLGKALASFARICYNKFSFFTGPQDARFFVCFAAKNRDAKGAVCL